MSDSNTFSTPQLIAIAVGAVGVVIAYFWKNSSNGPESSAGHGPPIPQPPERLARLPVGKLTLDQISSFNGENDSRILCSVCGRIFDLTKGRDFYGHPDGPYNCFTGADASYMLGAMSLDPTHRNKKDFEQDGDHIITLSDWISRFRSKYPIVGRLEGYQELCPESWREAGNDDEFDDKIKLSDIYGNDFKVISASDLSECSKYENDNSWLSVCGVVFNVKAAEIVYEAMYGDFVDAIGHDISVALATHQFTKEIYNQPLSDLQNDKQKLAKLNKCFKCFLESYPIVGFLQDDENKYRLQNVAGISEEWDMVDGKEAKEEDEADQEPEKEEEVPKESAEQPQTAVTD
eukprot:498916_1